MKEILDNIYTWSIFSDEKQLNFNGWFIPKHLGSTENIAIDPPKLSNHDLQQMKNMGGVQKIIITNQHHIRWATNLQEKFNASILINIDETKELNLKNYSTFSNDCILAGFLQTIVVPNNKTLGETALYWAERNILILGDALIGDPAGHLRLLPDEKYADVKRARDGIKILLNYDFDILLLGDGDSILGGAKTVVSNFCNQ